MLFVTVFLALSLATCDMPPPRVERPVEGPLVSDTGTGHSAASLRRRQELSERLRAVEEQIKALKKQLER